MKDGINQFFVMSFCLRAFLSSLLFIELIDFGSLSLSHHMLIEIPNYTQLNLYSIIFRFIDDMMKISTDILRQY